jgi:hypothetical protein
MIFGKTVATNRYEQATTILEMLAGGRRPNDEDTWRFLVLEYEADRLGIRVGDDEIKRGLRQWVAAVTGADEGKLDAAYRTLLAKLRTKDEWARFAISRQLQVNKLLEAVAGAVSPSDAQAWQAYVETTVQLEVKTLKVKIDEFRARTPKPDEAALAAYYDAHKAEYLVPAKVTVGYMSALKSEFESRFAVSDDEVASYYEARKTSDYLSTDSLVGAQAAGSTDSGAAAEGAASTESEAAASTGEAGISAAEEIPVKPLSEVAGEIKMKLAEQKARGAIIDAQVDATQQKDVALKDIAERYGLPYATVGPFAKAEQDKMGVLADARIADRMSLVDQLFSKNPSDLYFAQSPAGYFLCKLETTEPEHQPALADIRDKVEADYVTAEAEKAAGEEAAKVLDGLKANGWGNYDKDPRYEVTQMPLGPTAAFGELFRAAATTGKGEFGGPVKGPGGMYDFQVLARVEPKFDAFNQMKAFVKLYRFMGDKQEFVKAWEDDLYKRANVKQYVGTGANRAPGPMNVPYY